MKMVQKITLEIGGMMCGMCENHVNDAIRNEFTVKKVISSHTKNRPLLLQRKILKKRN